MGFIYMKKYQYLQIRGKYNLKLYWITFFTCQDSKCTQENSVPWCRCELPPTHCLLHIEGRTKYLAISLQNLSLLLLSHIASQCKHTLNITVPFVTASEKQAGSWSGGHSWNNNSLQYNIHRKEKRHVNLDIPWCGKLSKICKMIFKIHQPPSKAGMKQT